LSNDIQNFPGRFFQQVFRVQEAGEDECLGLIALAEELPVVEPIGGGAFGVGKAGVEAQCGLIGVCGFESAALRFLQFGEMGEREAFQRFLADFLGVLGGGVVALCGCGGLIQRGIGICDFD
jgi:hypothetical protein